MNETQRFDLGNGVTLHMISIPAGSFDMGSNEQECEQPIHRVNIQPFYMGKYLVTQAEYQAIMGNNPSHFKGRKHPVEKVSWDMAQEFCQKLSEKTGKKFSLPSESQWEYACKAGSTTKYYFGDTLTPRQANFDNNLGSTTEVRIYPPNAFGLYDMHGNVWEWCEDTWHDNYENAPTDGSAWVSSDDETNRKKILRGGAWAFSLNSCYVALRFKADRASFNGTFGFRVSCEAE